MVKRASKHICETCMRLAAHIYVHTHTHIYYYNGVSNVYIITVVVYSRIHAAADIAAI